jgi:hypothetical protein
MLTYPGSNLRLKKFNRSLRLAQDRALYVYLPALDWMKAAGYLELSAGSYECIPIANIAYRLTILSQTTMLLGFRNSIYMGAKVVETDEELLRFLVLYNFPLPA